MAPQSDEMLPIQQHLMRQDDPRLHNLNLEFADDFSAPA